MKISKKEWTSFIERLRKVDDKASEQVVSYMETHEFQSKQGKKELLDYAYAVATKYGEGASALACLMYDAVSKASVKRIPPAEPAKTATYGEVARAVNGALLYSPTPQSAGSAVGRLVRTAGADTTIKNAIRDGAEWAWIPSGDSCPFCSMIASQGWLPASKDQLNGDHADHIHNNCDCTFAIRHDGESTVEGYDPDALREQWNAAEGSSARDKLNFLRRQNYAANRDAINAQKRAAYARKNDIDNNEVTRYNNSPAKKEETRELPQQLSFAYCGLPEFIPNHTIIEAPIIIAGKGSSKELRIAEKLAQIYAEYENDPDEWMKMVGKIQSDKYLFDIHWYECKDKVVRDPKIKFMKELR